MTYTILSDRTDELLWGGGAIVVALLVLRALSLAIMRLERGRSDGEGHTLDEGTLSRYERRVLVH